MTGESNEEEEWLHTSATLLPLQLSFLTAIYPDPPIDYGTIIFLYYVIIQTIKINIAFENQNYSSWQQNGTRKFCTVWPQVGIGVMMIMYTYSLMGFGVIHLAQKNFIAVIQIALVYNIQTTTTQAVHHSSRVFAINKRARNA